MKQTQYASTTGPFPLKNINREAKSQADYYSTNSASEQSFVALKFFSLRDTFMISSHARPEETVTRFMEISSNVNFKN